MEIRSSWYAPRSAETHRQKPTCTCSSRATSARLAVASSFRGRRTLPLWSAPSASESEEDSDSAPEEEDAAEEQREAGEYARGGGAEADDVARREAWEAAAALKAAPAVGVASA